MVISNMVKDLNINLDVKICPTVRESDGLAMSSRNGYLKKCEAGRGNLRRYGSSTAVF